MRGDHATTADRLREPRGAVLGALHEFLPLLSVAGIAASFQRPGPPAGIPRALLRGKATGYLAHLVPVLAQDSQVLLAVALG